MEVFFAFRCSRCIGHHRALQGIIWHEGFIIPLLETAAIFGQHSQVVHKGCDEPGRHAPTGVGVYYIYTHNYIIYT